MFSLDVTWCPVLGAEEKTAWDTWTTYEDITSAFIALGNMPDLSAIYDWIQQLERFVVLLYDCTSTEEGVIRKENRKQLFSKKSKKTAVQQEKQSYCWSASYTSCAY